MTNIARGLEGVVLTESKLSSVNGAEGKLIIGGFPIGTLAPLASFEEVIFLLWHDRLPTQAEINGMREHLARAGDLGPETLDILRAAAKNKVHPMDALLMGFATIGLRNNDVTRVELQAEPLAANQRRALTVVGMVPAIIGAFYRLSKGKEPVAPEPGLSHAANYLKMLSGETPDPARARALETYLNTTIDHGMNASTFASRVIASTRSDIASSVLGALGALKGPLHGGAPGPALEMVYALQAKAKETGRSLDELTDEHVRKVVAGRGRVMGFGHRVYRVRDPRADVLGAALENLFPEPGQNPVYDDARTVERAVLKVLVELKPHRPLATNVEFYTALLLRALDLPLEAFTPTFAVARVGGWSAHILEQVGEDRLIRPSSAYIGNTARKWVPIEER